MAETHFLVDGADCQCKYGTTPDKLIVLSQSKDYINDGDGSKKLIASTKDIGLPFEKKTFGNCTKQNSPCVPNVTAWHDECKNVTLSNSGKILTKDSKGQCFNGDDSCISIINHGQQATITPAHFDQIQPETLTFLNPLVPLGSNRRREIPKIKTIKVTCNRNKEGQHSKNNKPNAIVVLQAAVDESLQFDVEEFINGTHCNKALTGWQIIKAHSFEGETTTFKNTGNTFKVNFDAVGKYRVIAFGGAGDAEALHRCIDVEVIANKITDVEIENAALHSKIINNSTGNYIKVRRGVPVTIKATYLFTPVKEDDKSRVSARIIDVAENEMALSSTDSITFTPANTATTYTVKFTMVPANEGEQEITVQRTLKSDPNGVLAVTCAQGQFIRPATAMHFEVSKLTYSTLVDSQPFELAAVKWQLNGRDVGTGGSITLDSNYFTRGGNYVMEAYVETANAFKNGKISDADGDDDWRFTVQHNEITELIGAKEWIVGKQYDIKAETIMPYKKELDGAIIWSPKDIDTTPQICEKVYANGVGIFSVTATLNNKTKKLIAKANIAVITRWCFTDGSNVYKPKAGWNEKLNALITCKEAAGEKVNIHLLEYDSTHDSNYIKDLGDATFDVNGDAKITFNTSDIKSALNKLWFEERNGGYYDLYFGILKKEGGLQFANIKTKKVAGKEYYFPNKENNHTNNETGKFVFINSSKEIVSVKFTDSSGFPAYKVYKYGEEITVHIQTKNMAGDDVESTVKENIKDALDKKIPGSKFKIDNTETTERIINTGADEFKAGKTAAELLNIRMFYYQLYNSKTGQVWFPKQVSDKEMFSSGNVSFYNHIKLSGIADKMNNILRPIAPVVLGEAFEGESHESGDCPRCKAPVTAADLKTIFPKASDAVLTEAAAAYTKYMTDLGMDTCWNKAHFFAQAAVESGESFTLKKGESMNYSAEDLFKGRWSEKEKKYKAIFSYYFNNNEAYIDGRTNAHPANERAIANNAYADKNRDARHKVGNTEPDDGWNFRGRGCIQLTGRGNYTKANEYTKKYEAVNILENPEIVSTTRIAVLTSMAYWRWNGLQIKSNGTKNVIKDICSNIGANINIKSRDGKISTTNYEEKQKVFNEITSDIFKIDQCTFGKKANNILEGDCNKYKIEVDKFLYPKIQKSTTSNKYQYDIYNKEILIKTFVLTMNDYKLLPFPESGINWDRFGTRDKGGDNWIDEKVAAALLGFFYSLPENSFTGTLYFNDISANDQRNIGHAGHKIGNDIDIRYPGSTNNAGRILWSTAKTSFSSEEEFIKVLENILSIAGKWKFNKNYAYKIGIKNTTGAATSIHQDHFHLGLR